ncbi:hypothetical protein BDZ91DRAFT_799906 [Kalaharituber pfeilii]|nr:hypothetical protein BDZ91DRAFT_799906 [Kalaharituber pfeilii]
MEGEQRPGRQRGNEHRHHGQRKGASPAGQTAERAPGETVGPRRERIGGQVERCGRGHSRKGGTGVGQAIENPGRTEQNDTGVPAIWVRLRTEVPNHGPGRASIPRQHVGIRQPRTRLLPPAQSGGTGVRPAVPIIDLRSQENPTSITATPNKQDASTINKPDFFSRKNGGRHIQQHQTGRRQAENSTGTATSRRQEPNRCERTHFSVH